MIEKQTEEKKFKVTEGGYEYIETSEGSKIRNFIGQRRLDEDNETQKEYRLRLKLVKDHEKQQKKGKVVWFSNQWGTLTADKAFEVYNQIKDYKEKQLKKEEDGTNQIKG